MGGQTNRMNRTRPLKSMASQQHSRKRRHYIIVPSSLLRTPRTFPTAGVDRVFKTIPMLADGSIDASSINQRRSASQSTSDLASIRRFHCLRWHSLGAQMDRAPDERPEEEGRVGSGVENSQDTSAWRGNPYLSPTFKGREDDGGVPKLSTLLGWCDAASNHRRGSWVLEELV